MNQDTERTRRAGEPPNDRGMIEWSSPRPISTARLNALLRVHLRPIKLVIYQRPYPLNGVGDLILGRASCLDAFSAYHFPT